MWVENLDGLVWLVVLIWPLLYLQRCLHREIQSVFLLITRRVEISLTLFSLLFLPGVFLHETSHYLMARLLGVPTGRFSLLPRTIENGRLQLGYVETGRTDVVRDSLIGMAPLITGGICVALTGLRSLGLDILWVSFRSQGLPGFANALKIVTMRPDFWLWFYLTFVISSTMLPSASDRRAWLSVVLVIGSLLAIVIIAGAGPWLIQHLAPPLNIGLRSVAVVFGISVVIHGLILLPVYLLRKVISRIVKLKVV
jgi:hypothetical protein